MSTAKNSAKWYHGKLNRVDAEEVLANNGFAEGLFLVRESSTASGDYVLSVVHDGAVIHYQIRRRGEDALFSLSEEQKVIHGLDELVYYYQHQVNSGLQHKLNDFVPGEVCPVPVRLHGTENLLHRATSAGDANIVFQMLQCKEKDGRDMRAKNPDGQCAAHLAAFYGHDEVLSLLIEYGGDPNLVNVADSSGYTPLHVACQANNVSTVQLLLEAKANPTTRNQITDWVPLHEAAWKGHVDCARVLIEVGDAPVMSRTGKDETPADLARANGMNDMAEMLEECPWYQPISSRQDWLHPMSVGRQDAIEILGETLDDGTFLIRESQKKASTYVLSMVFEKAFYHFVVETRGIYVFLDQGPYMLSLEHLVDHYSRYPDGLPCILRHPISVNMGETLKQRLSTTAPLPPKPPKQPPSILVEDFDKPTIPPRVPQRETNTNLPSNLKPIDKKKVYENNESLRRVRHSRDAIPAESIHMIHLIGEGEFGCVYKGLYMPEKGRSVNVAIKVLSELSPALAKDFTREANVMMNLDHQSIVNLIGISSGPSVLMVLELVPLGSMLDYLKENRNSVRTNMEIPLWAAQIACGMMYLEQKKFIHRDLAARNILLASKLQAKISDFGLSRIIGDGKDYYQASQGGRWPIKWYAPECVMFGTFSNASDVWSYGVLLWEMYTYGDQPYGSMTGAEVVKYIEAGQRLQRPPLAEIDIYATMTWCWEEKAADRPSFNDLFKKFTENPEYSNLVELLRTQDLGQLDHDK